MASTCDCCGISVRRASTVAVDDAKTGDAFTIAVREDERALEVFHHPYAYAAFRGIETRASALVAA